MSEQESAPPPPQQPEHLERGLGADVLHLAEQAIDVGLPAYIGAKLGNKPSQPPPPEPEPPQVLPPGVESD